MSALVSIAAHVLLGVLLVALNAEGRAEIVDTSATGFLVRHSVTAEGAPDKAYRAIIDVARWWNPEHTYSGDAVNLSLDARPGGCFCEKLKDGGGVMHMSVAYVAPGQAIRLVGGLGPLQGSGVAGSMAMKVSADGANTRIDLAYSVGGYWQGGFDKIAPGVNAVLGEQMGRLKTYIDTGKPTLAK